jgi:hypothetical protein
MSGAWSLMHKHVGFVCGRKLPCTAPNTGQTVTPTGQNGHSIIFLVQQHSTRSNTSCTKLHSFRHPQAGLKGHLVSVICGYIVAPA